MGHSTTLAACPGLRALAGHGQEGILPCTPMAERSRSCEGLLGHHARGAPDESSEGGTDRAPLHIPSHPEHLGRVFGSRHTGGPTSTPSHFISQAMTLMVTKPIEGHWSSPRPRITAESSVPGGHRVGRS